MSVIAAYTPGEVVWLLQMDREQAISYDAYPRSSCADLSEDPHGSGSSDGDDELFVIARWWDVMRASARITTDKQTGEIAVLRARGYTEEEVGRMLGLSQPTVHRRFRASLKELLLVLGEFHDDLERESRIPACLTCGQRPRVRLAAIKRRVKGGWRTVQEERQAGVCAVCLREDLRPRALAQAA